VTSPKGARIHGSVAPGAILASSCTGYGPKEKLPEYCGPARPVSQAIIQATLSYIPTESLIQHEWATHGTCSGLDVVAYFTALRKDQPLQRLNLSPAQIESRIAAVNPSFPHAAFRTSCYRDGELQEVRVCLNKDLSPRACGRSAGECTAASVTLQPIR
jgi:ribonuclease T2